MAEICALFGISRQAYYQYRRRQIKREEQEVLIVQQVTRIRRVLPGTGGKKLYSILRHQEYLIDMHGYGRDKFMRLLKESNLLIKRRRSKPAPGTDSSNTQMIYENLKKKREISRSNELIESDMTAIQINESYKPLAICMDVYSRKILGWNLSKNWSTEETLKALADAERESGEGIKGSIHHSDRGSQYGSIAYREKCKQLGITGSMSRKAKPTDAAHIERLNRTLKREFNLRRKFNSMEEARDAINCAIIAYNEIRPHWSLDLKTPSMVYAAGKGK